MHVLITGAGSFIGRFTTEAFSSAGLRVTATYYSESKEIQSLRGISNAPELIRLDLGNKKGYDKLPNSIDAVVHIAGLSNMPGCTVEDILNCNVNGTRNIQEYALLSNACCLIYMSSLMVHGHITVPVVDETIPIIDPDIYGASKFLGERILAATTDRLPVAAVRLPGVLGPSAGRAWIPKLFKQINNHQDVTIVNPEAKFNNAIHVLDLADFILTILAGNRLSGFHAFPLASSGTRTIREIAEYLKEATKSHSKIMVDNSRLHSFTICSEYAVKNFGYCPKDISETLKHYSIDAL